MVYFTGNWGKWKHVTHLGLERERLLVHLENADPVGTQIGKDKELSRRINDCLVRMRHILG